MKVNFVCDQCNNCIDESVSLFQVNNPPNLYRYTSICDGCVKARLLRTAKAQSKAEWVAVARECYSGWLGPFGRFWCGIMAGNIFDQAWYQAHRAESPAESAIRECRATGRYGVTPLPDRKPASDELCLKTKHGEFLWRRSDTAAEPAPCEFGGFQAGGFTHPGPVTWQQESPFYEENADVGDASENGEPKSEALVGDVSSLAHLITTAIDKADGRDYSVILKYKKCGDLATAKVGIEVVGTEVVVANVCDDVEMKVAQAYTPPDVENGPDSAVETIDLSYGSDFDKVMDAVYDVVRTGQLPGLDKSLLSGPDWNQFYCAVKAMRRANYGCARDRGQ